MHSEQFGFGQTHLEVVVTVFVSTFYVYFYGGGGAIAYYVNGLIYPLVYIGLT